MAFTTIQTSSEAAVQASVSAALTGRRSDDRGRVFEVALLGALLVSLLILAVLISRILIDGLPVFS